jgi:hypothetical protein
VDEQLLEDSSQNEQELREEWSEKVRENDEELLSEQEKR